MLMIFYFILFIFFFQNKFRDRIDIGNIISYFKEINGKVKIFNILTSFIVRMLCACIMRSKAKWIMSKIVILK